MDSRLLRWTDRASSTTRALRAALRRRAKVAAHRAGAEAPLLHSQHNPCSLRSLRSLHSPPHLLRAAGVARALRAVDLRAVAGPKNALPTGSEPVASARTRSGDGKIVPHPRARALFCLGHEKQKDHKQISTLCVTSPRRSRGMNRYRPRDFPTPFPKYRIRLERRLLRTTISVMSVKYPSIVFHPDGSSLRRLFTSS